MKSTRIITFLASMAAFTFVLLAFTAVYSSPATAPVTQQPTPTITSWAVPTTTTLRVSSPRIKWPDFPVLSARVTMPNNYPVNVGKVAFYDGGTLIGVSSVNANGNTTIPYYGVERGIHEIVAVYLGGNGVNGGAIFTESKSTPVQFEMIISNFMIH